MPYLKKTKLINKNKEQKEKIENEIKKSKNENGYENGKHIIINQEIKNNKLRKIIIELLEEFKNKSEKNKELKEELNVIKMEYLIILLIIWQNSINLKISIILLNLKNSISLYFFIKY